MSKQIVNISPHGHNSVGNLNETAKSRPDGVGRSGHGLYLTHRVGPWWGDLGTIWGRQTVRRQLISSAYLSFPPTLRLPDFFFFTGHDDD